MEENDYNNERNTINNVKEEVSYNESYSNFEDVAKLLYENFGNFSTVSHKKYWSSEFFNTIFLYDVMRLVGVLSLFPHDDDFKQITDRIDSLTSNKNSYEKTKLIVKYLNENSIINDIYLKLPYSVELVVDPDKKRDSSIPYFILLMLEAIVIYALYPDGTMPVNERTYLLCAVLEIYKNYLLNLGIKEPEGTSISVISFSEMHCIYENKYIGYDNKDIDGGEILFRILLKAIADNTIAKIEKESRNASYERFYSVEEFKNILRKSKIMDSMIESTKKLRDKKKKEIDHYNESVSITIDATEHLQEMLYDTLLKQVDAIDDINREEPFTKDFVNENNYKSFWNIFNKISIDYRKKDSSRLYVKEWKSDLCYSKGKFLENILWTGDKVIFIPDLNVSSCSFDELNYDQLKFYIYWRTCFRNKQEVKCGNNPYYYIYLTELLVDLGPFTPQQRLQQLEELYLSFWKKGLDDISLLREYADLHGLKPESKKIYKWAYKDSDYCKKIYDLHNGNYDNCFEIMCKKSKWKIKDTSFVKRSGVLSHIINCVYNMIPEFDTCFKSVGISFFSFLAGRVKKNTSTHYPYSNTIWHRSTLNRLGIKKHTFELYEEILPTNEVYIFDKEGAAIDTEFIQLKYYDPYLSEYILKRIEMLFREYFGYEFISMPEKQHNAIKYKCGSKYKYIMSADPVLFDEQKKYLSLYDEICMIIESNFEKYVKKHNNELLPLVERFNNEITQIN